LSLDSGSRIARACCRRTRLRHVGFTLAEILVVLIVVGIAAGIAYARLESDPRQSIEREGRRFASAMEHAASLAQWRNQSLGVSAGGASYRFWRRDHGIDGDRWLPLTDDEVLATRTLPDGITAAAVQYAGQGVSPDAILPLSASGLNEPYVMELASPPWHAQLVADPLNRVAISAVSSR
jgi:type II secretion system protein H